MKNEIFYNYVNKQWLTGRYKQWQLFRSPPGYARSNSNIESFNAVIKRNYTKRIRKGIIAGMDVINDIVGDYSNDNTEFAELGRYTEAIHTSAKALKNDIFREIPGKKVRVNGASDTYIINDSNCVNNCSCNCPFFYKYCVCKHLLAFCIINNWHNKVDNRYIKTKTYFQAKVKKGAHKKAEKALVRGN